MPGRLIDDVAQVSAQQIVDQLHNTVTPGAGRDHVGGLLDRGQGVGDSNRAAADRQEGMVVLGIASAHDIVARETKLAQGRLQAGCFVDAGRQHHHGALVEGDQQLEAKLADHLEDHRLHRLPGRDDAAADGQWLDAALAQARHERLRRRVGDRASRGRSPARRARRRFRRRRGRTRAVPGTPAAGPAARAP